MSWAFNPFTGQLDQVGTPVTTPPYGLGGVSGSVNVDPSMGPQVYCYITGNTTFNPTGGMDALGRMSRLRLVVEFATSSGYTVGFGDWVGQPSLDSVTLPFEMTSAWQRASFDLVFEAGCWTLERVVAFTQEGTD